ncbi:MAG: Ig-like domain-containing protein [Pseudomonadota bacterium]|nr:Ig-like domain-containing protein [Pseudomonadota bacterium]
MSNSETKISESTGETGPQGITPVQKGIAVGLLLLLGAGWLFLHNRPAPTPTEATLEERAPIPPNRLVESDASEADTSPTEPNQENSTTATPLNQSETQDTGVKVIERAEEPLDGTTIPSFDVVTINPGGHSVLAGRAEPGATVRIRINGKIIGTTTADASGEWVFIPQDSLAEGVQEIDLVSETSPGGEVHSAKVVVAIIPEKVALAEDSVEDKAGSPVAVLMARDGQGLDQILQGKQLAEGLAAERALTLDILNYDARGQIDFSGQGLPDKEIRAYINNQLIGIAKVSPDGTWQLTPEDHVQAGLYNLRIDQIDLAGNVISRLETPFSMASFERPTEGEGLVVVQPGNSLWRIARRLYGQGIRYTTIFVANKEQIRDPSLIYPGQIFVVPGEG